MGIICDRGPPVSSIHYAISDQNVISQTHFQTRHREGIGREGKRERDRGERVGDACYKNPLLFISVDAGVRKFLIG